MHHPLLAVYLECMAGVVATLEANHQVRAHTEPIDDLSLAFIAPLDAYYYDCCHVPKSTNCAAIMWGSSRSFSITSSSGI